MSQTQVGRMGQGLTGRGGRVLEAGWHAPPCYGCQFLWWLRKAAAAGCRGELEGRGI